MKKADWKDTVEIFGIAAIVASLVFVGFEIKQSRDIAIADVYQQQAALLVEIQTYATNPQTLQDAQWKHYKGEELSERESISLFFSHNPWITYYENIHFQYTIGMLTEEHWTSIKNEIRNRVRSNRFFLEYWERSRDSWRSSFAEEVDAIIREESGRGTPPD